MADQVFIIRTKKKMLKAGKPTCHVSTCNREDCKTSGVCQIAVENKRTLLQNKALHKYLSLLATALNEAGWDMKRTLKPGIEIPWTEEMVKTHLWKSVQEVMLAKESTTELTTKEVNDVYEVVDRHLSQTTGVHVEFPKDEEKPR